MSIDIDKLFEGAYYDDEKKTASGTPKREENKTDNKTDIDNNNIDGSTAGGDHDLPPDFISTLQGIIKQWCIDNDIETMQKAKQQQWSAVCMFIGQYIKNNRILADKEKTAARGGVIAYDIKKVDALLDLWVYLCNVYGKVALVNDFVYFAGVSKQWLYNNNGHCELTSAGGALVKKLSDIQAAAIGSGIVDGRENPTGKIYFSKAVLGWSESGIMRQNNDDLTENNGALPDLSVLSLPNNEKQ